MEKRAPKLSVIIPLYNGGDRWLQALAELNRQRDILQTILVIDSSSSDNSLLSAKHVNFDTVTISSNEFNHGGTRNYGVSLLKDVDIVIFLTQDAILNSSESLANIVTVFEDPNVAIAYGRQLPHTDANPIATHARHFNYKDRSYIADLHSKDEMGMKTVFNSNSFAAYRVSTFNQIGRFPDNTILGEDMYFAAKAVLAGYKIAYVADATVRHSHNYSPLEEFKRYFDIGVFHHDNAWIRQKFGGAGSEGRRFLFSEFYYLLRHAPLWIPLASINNLLKIIGYKLGQHYPRLPFSLIKACSMHKRFWAQKSIKESR
ncbi:glycosyltransferase [Orbaceae bacterium ESL0721]|nr:glycosyltransferase [Orbaceae bacterium ESL0721]